MATAYRVEVDPVSGTELALLNLVTNLEPHSVQRGHPPPSKTKLRDLKRNALPHDWRYLGVQHGTTPNELQLVTVCIPSDAEPYRRKPESRAVQRRNDVVVQVGRAMVERHGDQRGVVFYDQVWLADPLRCAAVFVVHRPAWSRLAWRFDESVRQPSRAHLQRRWGVLCDLVVLVTADLVEEQWLWHPFSRRTRVLVVPSTDTDPLPLVLPPLLEPVAGTGTDAAEQRGQLVRVIYSILETVPAGLDTDQRVAWQDQLTPLRATLANPAISLTRASVAALLPATPVLVAPAAAAAAVPCTAAKPSCAPARPTTAMMTWLSTKSGALPTTSRRPTPSSASAARPATATASPSGCS